MPVANEMHAVNAIAAAKDIIAFVAARRQQVPYGLDIRIGIHSGPLIAGIIGVKKFAYDIWGDTVNTAARMEQNSIPGRINISENTCSLVKENYTCTYRGKIEVKGKGALDMYFVE
ncbi:Adenylate and Guanylate cyclase catalytic domain protein [compost metagenome]